MLLSLLSPFVFFYSRRIIAVMNPFQNQGFFMLKTRRRQFVSLLLIASLCHAEEPAAPKPDLKTDAKSDSPTAAASATESALPAFPLKSEWFSHIADTMPDDKTYGDETEAQQIEMHALEDVLVAVNASPEAHLKKSVREIEKKGSFRALMKDAELYRGSVVQIRGLLENSERFPIPENKSSITEPFRGQISNISGQIFSFISIERPPQELLKHPVRLTGVFIKRYAYKNRLAGEKLTWTPLLVVKKVEAFSEADVASPPMSKTTAMLVAFAMVALFVRIYWKMNKQTTKGLTGNPFTKLKNRIADKKSTKKPAPPKPLIKPDSEPGGPAELNSKS